MGTIKHGYPNNPRIRPPADPASWRAAAPPTHETRLWALEAIDAPGAWLIPLVGPQHTVCLIDQGFDPTHQDLAPTGSAKEKWDITGTDKGHGTRVGGIIAAAHNTGHGRAGVCPGACIQPFKVGQIALRDWSLGPFGIALDTTARRIGSAIAEINQHFYSPNCRVINISKSGRAKDAQTAGRIAEKYLLASVDTFLNRGGVLVVAGDNDARVLTAECVPAAIKQVSSRPDSILVTGSVAAGTDRLWGGTFRQLYRGQNDVDVYAPGGDQEVLEHRNPAGYTVDRGNSLAAPHVAGIAALLFRINPDLDGQIVARVIRETAELQQTDPGKEPLRLVNAFAAALKVYNATGPEQVLAGYRVSMPVAFRWGTLEVNGEPIPISTIGLGESFCRFTAPLDLPIRARLYKHPDSEDSGERRCYWEGEFQDLLNKARPGSQESAWSHASVPALRTVRLQGIAARVYYPGKRDVVQDTEVLLQEKSRGTLFGGRTDAHGYCVIPFGEPGKYLLTVEDSGVHYTTELDLQGNTIHEEDIVLGNVAGDNVWGRTWAGEVQFRGYAAVLDSATNAEKEQLVGYPGSLRQGDLYAASGSIRIKVTSHGIDKETLIHRVLVKDEFIEDLVHAEGPEAVTDDMLPALSPVTVRAFSETMCRLRHGFSAEINDSLRDWEFGAWGTAWGAHEKDQFLNLPAGLLLAAGTGDVEFELHLPTLIRGLLQARLEQDPDEQHRVPLWLDIAIHWCLDYTAIHGEGSEGEIAGFQGWLYPAPVPYKVEHLSRDKWRVVAGPAAGLLEFVAHPQTPLRIEQEPGSCPAGCIAATVEEPSGSGIGPWAWRDLYVLSSQGELSLIGKHA